MPVAQLIAALPEAVRRRLDLQHRLPALLTPSRLPPQGGQAVLAALQRLSPTTAEWLASLREAESPVADEHAARLREERDAVSPAIDLAGIAAPDDLLYTPGDGLDSSTAFGATFNPLYVMDNEDDLLTEDLRRFDPHNQLQMRSASVARFTSDRFALTVMNVNRKPLEQALGVDLVYYDEVAQIFTLVQYKRLVRRPASGDGAGQRWAYTSQDELVKHLQRRDIGPNEPVNSKDWRMAPSPFWFKFVRDGDFTPGDPFVLKGMYVPADYLRLALADGSLRTGPRTGFEVTYSNTRYLPREVFVELVRRGFAGTTRAGTHAVAQVVVERAKTHEVVLALKTPIGQDEPTNHSYRTTDEPLLSPSPEPWGTALSCRYRVGLLASRPPRGHRRAPRRHGRHHAAPRAELPMTRWSCSGVNAGSGEQPNTSVTDHAPPVAGHRDPRTPCGSLHPKLPAAIGTRGSRKGLFSLARRHFLVSGPLL